jgi:hypothetical protein
MMSRTLKGFIWLNIIGMFGYIMVILAMLYGWGLTPKSWFWMIFFYGIAENAWFIATVIRMWMLDSGEQEKKGDHNGE